MKLRNSICKSNGLISEVTKREFLIQRAESNKNDFFILEFTTYPKLSDIY